MANTLALDPLANLSMSSYDGSLIYLFGSWKLFINPFSLDYYYYYVAEPLIDLLLLASLFCCFSFYMNSGTFIISLLYLSISSLVLSFLRLSPELGRFA